MSGTIFNDKIKTLNPGVWLNDKVVNFMIELMLQDEEALRWWNPDRESYFIFTSLFMAQLLNRGPIGTDGEYTYANVKGYTSFKKTLICLLLTKYLSPSIIKTCIGIILQ